MGFGSRISNWFNVTGRKIYNGIRSGVSTGYNAVHNVAHKIGTVADGIDNAVSEARKIPLIGELATALQNHPYYQETKSLIKTGVEKVDKAGQIGDVVGAVLDKLEPVGNAVLQQK